MSQPEPAPDIGFFEKPTFTGLELQLFEIVRRYLAVTGVKMGDDTFSDRTCTLCEGKTPPAHTVCGCVCHPARDLLKQTVMG